METKTKFLNQILNIISLLHNIIYQISYVHLLLVLIRQFWTISFILIL